MGSDPARLRPPEYVVSSLLFNDDASPGDLHCQIIF